MKKIFLFIPLAILLIFGLSSSLSRAELEQGSSPVISMDFQDAKLKDVLKVFSQQAKLNFIAGEKVKSRKVTLYLDKVSVADALDTIMNANNLTYEQKEDSKIFVVKEWGKPEIETMTKVFPLQYARVRGYELAATGTGKIGIKEVIEVLLTEHGRIIEDSRTNSLIVTDLPTQFDKIEKTIKELDVKLPQVMIEAEIIEASLDTIDKLGIQWGDASTGALMSSSGASLGNLKFPFTKDSMNSKVGPGGNVSGLYMGYVSANNLGGTLAMLTKDTDTRILARPKILTLNNETAEIKITAHSAVSSGDTSISTEGGLGTSTVTIERYETGVSLLVTPQINNAGEITMSIEPSVITVKSSVVTGDYYDPHTRSAKTTVTIRDGETVIIGGLINTEDERISRKVPFFGDIPLLGHLFRKKDDTIKDKEVVIFITPHLLKEGTETAGLPLPLERELLWEDQALDVKREQAMEKVLDRFEQ